jgi:ectoine hydroxylase-related dioxygenase (phytanoyl-CoA dioxygenase family)
VAQREAVSAEPREITDDEVGFFRENGWVKLEQLISGELAAQLLAAVQGVMGTEPEARSEAKGIEQSANVKLGADRRGGQVQDTGYWMDYHFIARDDRIEPCYSLVFGKVLPRNAQRLMERDVAVRYSSDLVACKMPTGHAGGKPTDWHQDFASLPFDRSGGLAFWLALDEVTEEQGAMRFLNGSHREGNLGRTRVQGKGVKEYYPELLERYEMSAPLRLRAGDATAHHNLVCHGAPENLADRPRWAYIVAYFPGDALYTGAYNHNFSDIGLAINKPIDHPRFPQVLP